MLVPSVIRSNGYETSQRVLSMYALYVFPQPTRDRSCNITVFYGSENLCNLTVRFDKFHYILRGGYPMGYTVLFVGIQHHNQYQSAHKFL